jgi:FtsP/CotA-like multicopper oxidase with cupredoxin domain
MTTEISRRRALQVAGLGGVAAVVGAAGTWTTLVVPASGLVTAEAGRPLLEPPVRASVDGLLDVTLTAAAGAPLAGRPTRALGYDGTSPGPTLRITPGDVVRLTLTNRLDDTTNLHTHGLHVSPQGDSDNVFRTVAPGQQARYLYRLPADHPTGTFWYHPHHHGSVADQVFGGLFGALVVAPPEAPDPLPERVLIVSDTTLTSDGEVARASTQQVMAGREGELVLVNGQLRPRIDVGRGSAQRWRVVNACTSRFLRLQLDDHTWGFLGYDGQALGEPEGRGIVVLAPGNRADLLLSPSEPGTFTLRTLGHDRGGMGMMGSGKSRPSEEIPLATVRVEAQAKGEAAPSALASTGSSGFPTAVDLRTATVGRLRTVTFTMGMGMGFRGGMVFGFDGRRFDAGRVDQAVVLGSVEEWTLVNASPMDHPFHLHVWPMQVVAADDLDPSGRPDWRDVVIVPARGQATVRIQFTGFGGRTVYHCHVLDHEDQGMMGTIVAT